MTPRSDPPPDASPQLERLAQLDLLLDEGLDLGPDEQQSWLERIRSVDPRLAQELAELIASEPELEASGFLRQRDGAETPLTSLAGRRIGAYTLERPLGRGGMGTVWLARRSDGRFEGQAAIKLLNLPLLDAAGAERFRREATALARLTHRNIARLTDAGVADDGQPYLVLEYVDGVRLDRYADERRLSPNDRLALLLQVLDAVSHAHANLIVHRDIKPSNLLVTADGTVKLLDFGIAKLLVAEGSAGESSLLTDAAGSALTPEYAAPEQVTGAAVTVATDVYSLGVLLYLLLSGRHPTGQAASTPAEHLQRLLDVTPTRVSAAASRPAEGGQSALDRAAANRAASSERLRRLYRGDLDNIVAKALKKVPGERYGTVNAFADDIRRYLRHEPVEARADTLGYRAGKFVRRNRVAVAAATVAVGLLVAITIFALVQLGEARRQRDDARAQRDRSRLEERRALASSVFMQTVLGSLSPTPGGLTTEALLGHARALLDRRLWDDPRIRARILIDLADQHSAQQQGSVSDSLLRRAEAVADTAADAESAAMAECRLVRARGPSPSRVADLSRARAHLRAVVEPGSQVRVICLLAEASASPDSANGMAKRLRLLQGAAAMAAASGDSLSLVSDWALQDLARAYGAPAVHRLREAKELSERRLRVFRATGRVETAASYQAMLYRASLDVSLGEYVAAESLLASVPRGARSDIPNLAESLALARALLDARMGNHRSAARVFLALHRHARTRGEPGFEKYALGSAIIFLSDAGMVRQARALLPRFRSLPAVTDALGLDIAYPALAEAEGDHATALRWDRALIARSGLARGSISAQDLRLVLRMARSSLGAGDAVTADSLARYAIALGTRAGQDSTASAEIGRAFVLIAKARLALADSAGALSALRRALPGLANGLGQDRAETSAARALVDRLGQALPALRGANGGADSSPARQTRTAMH